MTHPNPLADAALPDAEDLDLVRRAQSGSKEALELLITRHQRWIYNIALRMVYHPQDAEDATQEILIKILTRLSTFRGESQFRTWLYRLVINHLLNMKRASTEAKPMTFEDYGRGLDNTPDADLPDPNSVPADVRLLVHEARIGCTSGMLLCLDREQRPVYVLGEIFDVTDRVGAELLDISRDSFRQKLARARRDLHNFMEDKCGLVKASNPCRCAKKTQGFIKAGYLDPHKLLFASSACAKWPKNAPTSSTRSTLHTPRSTGTTRSTIHPISSLRCTRSSSAPTFSRPSRPNMQMKEKTMQMTTDVDTIAATILSLERGALDRWNKGDVEGCLEIYADDVSYFDPITAARIDGLPAMQGYLRPWAGKIRIPRYEIINPQVVTDGSLAVLSYSLVNYVHAADGSETVGGRWNSTQVYRRTGDQWRVVHVHWSFTRHPAFENISPEAMESLPT